MLETRLFDPDQVSFPSGCLIAGELVAGEGEEFEVIRPSDGHRTRVERDAGSALVHRVVDLARQSHTSGEWRLAAPQHRAAVFRRWANLAETHADELVRLEATVSTRLASEAAQRDIPLTVAIIRYYGELIDKIEGQVLAAPTTALSLTLREPYGVVAAISPWNVPLVLAAAKLAPALAAGNAVILKPSELTPYSIIRLVQLAIEAGVPAAQIAIVPGFGASTGRALVTHSEIDYVSFTGSTLTGAEVMSDAAVSGPKPVSLELGGKSPQLVFADANLDAAAVLIAGSAVRNAGQICYAGTRLVVEECIADQLVDKIAALMAAVLPGPTWSSRASLSPIISGRQCARIAQVIARGVEAGAEVTMGGRECEHTGGGFFFQPTIVRGVSPTNPIVREEIFGPVLALQTFRGIEAGLALADHRDYGLAAGVHTRDIDKVMHCVRSLQTGTVWVNHYGPSDVGSPVGGYKRSGFGKDFGVDGLQKYLKTKHVWLKGG